MTKKRVILIVAIALILCLTLVASISIAYYQANRKATGIIVMDKGILFEFGNVQGEGKERDLLLTNDEVMDVSIQPSQVVEIKNPYIQPLTNTVPFYLRAKLTYKFYTGATEVVPADVKATLAELLVLDDNGNPFSFSADFLPDANKEWFYYCANVNYETAGQNQLVALNEESSQVDIFGSTELTVQNFTAEFGSPNDITKVEVYLVVEALQAASTSADVYNLPADGEAKGGAAPTTTTVDLENGSGTLTYIVEGDAVELTELVGTDPVITEANMSFADGKTLSIDPTIFEGLTSLTVYDKELLDYFAFDYYPNGLGELTVFTSEDLYMYLADTDAAQFLDLYICIG